MVHIKQFDPIKENKIMKKLLLSALLFFTVTPAFAKDIT